MFTAELYKFFDKRAINAPQKLAFPNHGIRAATAFAIRKLRRVLRLGFDLQTDHV